MALVSRGSHDNEEAVPSYLGRLTQSPLLNAVEEVRLTRAAQSGCRQSRARLIESNMRLVINIAKGYHSKTVPLEDLIQEGAIGLMHAVERFDPDKGFRFSTYATHWVRQAIGRAIDSKAKAIRLPAHVSQTLRRVERRRHELAQETGSEPTWEQLAAEMGLDPLRLRALVQSSQDMLSLDMRIGDHDSMTLGSLISDDRAVDPAESALNAEVFAQLEEALEELSERERRVMDYRLRANEKDVVKGREELSAELNISRERIRQIEIQAIKKLRRLAQKLRTPDTLTPETP